MRKNIFILLGSILLLTCCTEKGVKKNHFYILVHCANESWDDRTNKDYIRLWVDDSLMFDGIYYTNYIDSTQTNIDDVWGMKVARIDKSNRDSIKIRLRLVSLDSVSFAGKHAMDTTFSYRIDNIPGMAITDSERRGFFSVRDTISTPWYWVYY